LLFNAKLYHVKNKLRSIRW